MNTQILNTATQVKTIDIQAKQWFDKVNGNSYFASLVTVNFGMEDQKQIKVNFQYGYGESYLHTSFDMLEKHGIIDRGGDKFSTTQWARENNIILRYKLETKCLKRELINLTA